MQPGDRALAQAAKIARRIDPKTADIDNLATKPSRMRWRTYKRLEERHGEQLDLWGAELAKRLGFRI